MGSFFAIGKLDGNFVLTSLISIFAITLAILFPSLDRRLCCAAMIISSIGDILMMNFNNIGKYIPVPCFYAGAIAFMFAHIIYTAAFASIIHKSGKPYFNAGSAIGIAIFVISLAILLYFYSKNNVKPSLLIIAIIYVGIICINCTTVFSSAFATGGIRWISAFGVLLFFISDFFIGLKMFGGIQEFDYLIWWFYPIGQILLLIGG